MLTRLVIRDFAIVESLELEFGPGMTVLTGETGAGKSILVGALSLALGQRADAGVIRHGAERAEVTAAFEVAPGSPAAQWLQDQDLEAEGECILRRVIQAGGRSRAWVNGRPVPVQGLRDLGAGLVDIHGQHQHQSLLRREVQRGLLDAWAGNGELLARVGTLAARHRELLQRLEGARGDGGGQEHLELLRYQLEELQRYGPRPGEYEALDEEHRRLANAERLLQGTGAVLGALYEDPEASLHDRLAALGRELEALAGLDPALAAVGELLAEAGIQISEAASALRHYGDALELDPERLAEVEQRLAQAHELARKHGVAPEALPGRLEALAAEVAALETRSADRDALQAELEAVAGQWQAAAGELSAARRAAARRLDRRVTELLPSLGMDGARLEVRVEAEAGAEPRASGADRVEFLIATAAGTPPGPLAKIASGGELSRVGLALQTVFADQSQVPTLVYDEVDAGIGGTTAVTVGERLRELGERRQVLCVTHLAQVAARARCHLRVSKAADEAGSRSTIEAMEGEERVAEIARMLGGSPGQAQARAHAAELLRAGSGQRSRETA